MQSQNSQWPQKTQAQNDRVAASKAYVLHPFDSNVLIARLVSQAGGLWWFLDEQGRMNFRIEGESRAVGPCPEARLSDLAWHHLAVSRTSDEEEVRVACTTSLGCDLQHCRCLNACLPL
jgi:hypothetical protein